MTISPKVWRGILWLCLATNGVTAAPARPTPGAELFARDEVRRIQVELAPEAFRALQRDNRKYASATVREGTNVLTQVGVHLKGAAGSFRGLEDRPALTLGFSHFLPGQRFYGLRKIHLNNSVQDPSYMTEKLCGELFRKAGVPAARVTHAWVELNGRKLGLYVVKEGFTKDFLGQYFTNHDGNLYDGGFLRDITEPLELDGGEDVKDRADLKALAAAAQEPEAARRWARLEAVLDVQRFVPFMVVENMAWDWDGYVMKANNYRVYHDLDTGKMVFFPHGMDQMFWEPGGRWDAQISGLAARAVITTPEGRRRYRETYQRLYREVFTREFLTNRVTQLGAVLQSAMAEQDKNRARQYAGEVHRLLELVTARHAALSNQLSQPAPKPLVFDQGVARPPGWRAVNEEGSATLDRVRNGDGLETLHIQTRSARSPSWRAQVKLPVGRYRWEGRVRTREVRPIRDEKGRGAGLRIAGSERPRSNQLEGTADWTPLAYEFSVEAPEDEIELVCELRAMRGEAWFDLASLQLRRLK